MSEQKLVNIITCPWIEPYTGVQVPHGLRSNGKPIKPRSVMPEKGTSIIVDNVDETYVYFYNAGVSGDEVRFRVEHGHSFEVDGEEVAPFLWKGSFGDGAGTVQLIQTGDGLQGGPITGAGTIAMRPLTPSPAGVYGSASAVPVVTVNNKGQVTSVSTQPITPGGLTGVNVTAPITKGGTASTPIIGITLGNTASSACAGNDARLSDQRVPTDGSVTDSKVAAANKDGLAAVPSMRTLGTGAQQACAGDDARLLGVRTVASRLFALSVPNPTGNFSANRTITFPFTDTSDISFTETRTGRLQFMTLNFGYTSVLRLAAGSPTQLIASIGLTAENAEGVTVTLLNNPLIIPNNGQDILIPEIISISRYPLFGSTVFYRNLRVFITIPAATPSVYYNIAEGYLTWYVR